MKTADEDQLIGLIINWVRENKLTNGSGKAEINGDTNLLEAGLLDSLGFVELLLFIETQRGWTIDLTNADPEEFAVVKGLCRIALKNRQ